jgi:hypothetical protein
MYFGEWRQDPQVVMVMGNASMGGGTHVSMVIKRWLVEFKKKYSDLC